MSTAAELSSYIGQVGILTTGAEGLRVRVLVTDVKQAYGQLRLQVTHDGGESEAWVSAERVTLDGAS